MLRFNFTLLIISLLTISSTTGFAQNSSDFTLRSPDEDITLRVQLGDRINWSVSFQDQQVIAPSSIALHLQEEEIAGRNPQLINTETRGVNNTVQAINYKKDEISEHYNELRLTFKNDYGVIFRAYNSGVAYRFFTGKNEELTIAREEANFNFTGDHMVYIPYANDPVHDVYQISFENLYQHIPLSEVVKDTVAFAPVLVDLESKQPSPKPTWRATRNVLEDGRQ